METKSKLTKTIRSEVYDLAVLGLTDQQMAGIWEVSTRTVHRWKKDPEFMEQLSRGKARADARVAHALYQRATGYTDPAGKYYPPDTTACIFWLKNRQPGQWRDKHEQETTMKTDRLAELVNSIRNGEGERR